MSRDDRLLICDACGEIAYLNSSDGWTHDERFGDLCPDCAEVLLRVFERED